MCKYFISFQTDDGFGNTSFGNADITLKCEIDSMDDVRLLEETIKTSFKKDEGFHYETIIILNYILLKK